MSETTAHNLKSTRAQHGEHVHSTRAPDDSTRAQHTAARACGMTAEEWKVAKRQSRSHRLRGRIGHQRPAASLWDAVDGQAALFPETPGDTP
ncbi:hypothetical protein [Longimycelium tulufanense]|nr:hypothetical protein [Longimycelium tulufanense]